MSNFHSRIMNIPYDERYITGELISNLNYKSGHKDARHAAAEIASEADVKIAALELLIEKYGRIVRDAPPGDE